MSNLHQPLKRQLQRLIPEARNLQQSADTLVKALEKTSTTASDELEARFLTFAEAFITFLQGVRRVGGYGRELAEMPNVADRLADMMLVLDRLDYVERLDYIGLARRIENIQDADMVRLAVRELSTYEGGPERLGWLKAAIEEIEAGGNPKTSA